MSLFTPLSLLSSRILTSETPAPSSPQGARLGIALGAGAARGWAHIGVLQELLENDIIPDIVVGTSIGAIVGGCYASDILGSCEEFARRLTKRKIFNLMDWSLSGASLIGGDRIRALLDRDLKGLQIEQLPKQFAAVATELGTGHEIWLTQGDLVLSLQASYALPGIFEPVSLENRWLIDGALVNPIPVSVCRAMGAQYVIAVSLEALSPSSPNGHTNPSLTKDVVPSEEVLDELSAEKQNARSGPFERLKESFLRRADPRPRLTSTMMSAINIMQDRISRSRLAGDPPDVLVKARVASFGLFDFHRADELIALGREAVQRALPELDAYRHLSRIAKVP